MARRTPPRYKSGPKKGQFMPKSARRRTSTRRKRNPSSSRKRSTRRRSTTTARKTTRRRSYRRNPPKLKVLEMLKGGAIDAAGILVGEVAARTIPTVAKLPKTGAAGLAVQAGAGVVAGYAADRFVGRDFGRMVLAGALAAPLKTLIVSKNVPFLAPALSPTQAASDLGAYVGWNGLRGYRGLTPRIPRTPAGMSSYVNAGGDAGGAYDFELHG